MKRLIRPILSEEIRRVGHYIPLPKDIVEISNIFKNNGYKLYLVGGAIRDSLLGKSIKDYDLATDAVPDVVERIMVGSFKTFPKGKSYGVISIIGPSGDEYEVATFRKDIGGGRRPDGVEFSTIDHDVMRRDLTINALFYDISTREIVDIVGGIYDIKNSIIKAVGNPIERFSEDKLRILRAVRFASRLGVDIDKSTHEAILYDNSPVSSDGGSVSKERIRDEFIKGVESAKSVVHFLEMIRKYGLFNWVFPGLIVSHPVEESDYIVLISVLLSDNDVKTLPVILNKLTYIKASPLKEIHKIIFLISLLSLSPDTAYDLKKKQKISGISDGQILSFSKWMGLDKRLVDSFIYYTTSVNGDDLSRETGLTGYGLGREIDRVERDKFLDIYK